MNTKAIERIKGYCCEVTQEQWEELLDVVRQRVELHHALIIKPRPELKGKKFGFAFIRDSVFRCESRKPIPASNQIPFHSFLAKLKGEEWTPKAGEMVEYLEAPDGYEVREYAGYRFDTHLLWATDEEGGWVRDVAIEHLRPLRQTITRAEAEKQLGKRIID